MEQKFTIKHKKLTKHLMKEKEIKITDFNYLVDSI